MPLLAAILMALCLAVRVAAAGAAPPPMARLTVHLAGSAGGVSPLLFGCALPAPGTPGAQALLPELLRNRSFEKAALAGPKPMPEAWSKGRGWQLFAVGGKHVIVRTQRRPDEPLVLLGKRKWADYRLTLWARKIDGPGGLCVLFDVRDAQNHLRWTLGANGNCQHILESVGEGKPRLLTQPVPGRIESGRCYRIDVALRRGVLQCSLDGRLVHQIAGARFPSAGIGLGATDSTAEYFAITVHAPKEKPLFLLDDPAKARLDTLAADWAPVRSENTKVVFTWDPVYPFNSHFSQCVEAEASEGGEAGIRQGGIPIAAGTTYRGRLHMRGTGKTQVAVSLRGRDGRLYAAQEVGEPPGTWEARDFALTPAASDPQADFCITIGGQATVWFDQVSLAPECSRSPWALRSDVVAALRALRPSALCWPAGPAADHYNWRRGIGPPDERSAVPVTDGSRPALETASADFGTDEFLALCRELGAEPVLVLNPRLGEPALLDLMAYCNADATSPLGKLRAANGHAEPYGVRFWMVGGKRHNDPGGKDYTVALAELARDARGFRPPPQLIALGGPALDDCRPDATEAKQAGPMVTHIAKPIELPAKPEELLAAFPTVATAVRQLRDHGLHLALVDFPIAASSQRPHAAAVGPAESKGNGEIRNPNSEIRNRSTSPCEAAALLNRLSRDGGPHAMAFFTLSPTLLASATCNALALFRSHTAGESLHVEFNPPDPGQPPLDAFAGRQGGTIVIRIVNPTAREVAVRVRLEGLGGRRLAEQATHFALAERAGRQAATAIERQLAVQGNELGMLLHSGQPAHLLLLRLEGERP